MLSRTNSMMVSYKDYVAGWLDSSIHDFLGVFPRTSQTWKYALITCIDSNLDPSSLLHKSPELESIATGARVLGRGLLLPTELLLAANARNQLFYGFDEIWFFPRKRIEPKPDSTWLVGPSRTDLKKLRRLGEWMADNSCSLGFGDGEGLNFIIKARGLVKYLLAHSIEQPQPHASFVTSPTRDVAG